MRVFSVGPDEYDPPHDARIELVVYWYQLGDYDGSGEAVARGFDGTWYTQNLSHCSCYGGGTTAGRKSRGTNCSTRA